jgi:hypothetical protein
VGTPMLAVTKGLSKGLHIASNRDGGDELGLFGLQLPDFGTQHRAPFFDEAVCGPQLCQCVRDGAVHD